MATERTPQDYAIEHAGYMAEAAKHLMERINEEADARGAWESAGDDGEAMRTMQTRIYEFEKRRERAAASDAQAAQPQQVRKCLYCKREMIVGSEYTSAFQAGQCDMAPGRPYGVEGKTNG